jgi:glycosyltransferase involved in cell wall biosynthesis
MSGASPLVSVVTCTYNRGHLIGETIQSVLSQTYQHFEYIIVDDGSTDNTAELIASIDDSRLRYFRHERTQGHLSRLRNFAHQHCRGEIIAYVDSDDLWDRNKLETQIQGLMRTSAAGFSFTDVQTFDESGIIRKSIYNKPAGTFTGSVFQDMLANRLVICHTSLVLRRTCLDVTGPMDESMHSGDHDLVFMLSRRFDAFVVYEPMVSVRKHEGNSTSSSDLNIRLLREHHRTLRKLLDNHLVTQKDYLRAMGLTSYAFGHQLMAAGNFSAAAQYFHRSWKIRPWHIKSVVLLGYTSAKKILP